MSGGIYLLHDDDRLVEMHEQPYDSEAVIQELLAKHPSLLAGDQLGGASPRRWLLIAREASLPAEEDGGGRWSVDHLFLDQDAVPTLVEVKRASDTRIRREVVGQMLDYAANAVVYWPVERLRATFEAACDSDGRDAGEVVLKHLDEGETVDGFWDKTNTNLRAGNVRLVFVADELPPELQRVIEFLNVQMRQAEVIGIEVRQYVGQGLKTLVPRVLGQTAETQQRKGRSVSGPPREWSWVAYEQELGYSAEKLQTAKACFENIQNALSHRRLSWRPAFRNGYFGFSREGNYYVGELLVSDYGKLKAVAEDPTFAGFTPKTIEGATGSLETGTKQWIYQTLLGAAYEAVSLEPGTSDPELNNPLPETVGLFECTYLEPSEFGEFYERYLPFKTSTSAQYFNASPARTLGVLVDRGSKLPERQGPFPGTYPESPPASLFEPIFKPLTEGGLGLYAPWFWRQAFGYPGPGVKSVSC